MPEKDRLQELATEVKQDKTKDKLDQYIGDLSFVPSSREVKLTAGTVRPSEIYDRLNSGEYVLKYGKGYHAPTGNEDIYAKKQSGWDQFYNGVSKNLTKAGVYALDTVGLVYGLSQAISTGKTSSFWDNDFFKELDDWNKQLDYALPNYYTDEQKSMGLLRSLGTMNFWANDVAGGLAFVGGALLPSALLSIVTGGASLISAGAKIGFNMGTKGALSSLKGLTKAELLREVATVGRASEKGRLLLRGYKFANRGAIAGSVLQKGLFLGSSAAFEAGMEARQNFQQAMSQYTLDYFEKNGEMPSFAETEQFMKTAKSAADKVFGANLAILAVSNSVMFGEALLPERALRSLDRGANRLIGLGTRVDATTGRIVLDQATRTQKIAGKAYKTLGKALTEGFYEEGLQGVAGKTMQNYLSAKYDPTKQDTDGIFAHIGDAFAEQYGTTEGQKEILIGAIIGWGAGLLQGRGVEGFRSNSWTAERKRLENRVEEANKAFDAVATFSQKDQNFVRMMSDASYMSSSKEGENKAPSIAILDTALHFIRANEHIFTTDELKENFAKIIGTTEFSKEQMDYLTQKGLTVKEYADAQIESFNKHVDNYNFAKETAENLNIPQDITYGEASNVRDAFIRNVMLGKDAEQYADRVLNQISEKTKVGANVISFYEGLTQEQRDLVDEYQQKIEESEAKLKEFAPLDAERAALQESADPNKMARKNELAEQRLLLQQRLDEIENRKAEIARQLNQNLNLSQESLGQMFDGVKQFTTVEETVAELKKLDKYISDLENTPDRQKEAEELKVLLHNYKLHTDMHREFVSTAQKMVASDFFQSPDGRGLLARFRGPRYEMSDDVRKQLNKLDEDYDVNINEILESVGGRKRTTESVAEVVEELLSKNTKLSEREKFRLEAMMRMILTKYAPYTPQDFESAVEVQPQTNDLQGDTIESSEQTTQTEQKTTPEIIQQELEKIAQELQDRVNQNSPLRREKIKELEDRKAELEAELDKLKTTQKITPTTQVTRTTIDTKVAELKEKLQEVRADQSKEQDLEDFLNTFVEEATQSVGEDIDLLNEKLSQLRDLYDQRKTKPAKQRVQDKISDAKQEIQETTSFANELVTRLKETQNRKAQLQQAERDLQAQIAVYENLKETGQDNVEAINQKIERLQQKRNTLTSLLDKVSNAIQRAFSVLSDLVDSVFRKQNSIESFTTFTGFRRKTQEELQEAIRKGELENDYGQLNTELKELEGDLISSLDAVENQEGLISTLENERNNLDKAITKVDNHIRYLTELKVEIETQKQIEDAAKNNQQQEQKSPEQSSTSQYQGTDGRQQEEGQGERFQRETTQSETDNSNSTLRSKEIQDEIDQINQQLSQEKRGFILMETEDYKRMEELAAIENKTPEEEAETQALKQKLDAWMTATGIVSNGVRISDFIEQRVALEKAEIRKLEKAEEVEAEKVAEIADSKENKGRIYYENTQTHHKVTMEFKNDKLRVSGLNEEDIPNVFTMQNADGTISPIDFDYTVDAQNGNILIPVAQLDKFNTAESMMMIRPPMSKVPQTYSVMYKKQKNAAGKMVWSPVDSTYTDYTNPQNSMAIYDLEAGDELSLVIDMRDDFNKEAIEKYKKKKKSKAALEELIANLRINTYKGDTNLSDLKAISESDRISETDAKFIALRNRIVKENLEALMQKDAVVIHSETVRVQKIYPGHPSFLVQKASDNTFYFEPTRVSETHAKKIEDVGIRKAKDGKLETRKGVGQEKIDTTYLPKDAKNDLPFIVIRMGQKLIAYPVRMLETQRPDMNEFKELFEKGIDNHYKAIQLNKWMASVGLDVREKGNSFYVVGEANNLNEETYKEMVAKIENLDYFYPLKEWLDNKIPTAQIVEQRAIVNLDLSEPFHSPKIALDFSDKATNYGEKTDEEYQEDADAKEQQASEEAKLMEAIINKSKKENC